MKKSLKLLYTGPFRGQLSQDVNDSYIWKIASSNICLKDI